MWFYFFSRAILCCFTLKKKQEELVWNLNRSPCESCFSFWLRLWVTQGFCCYASSSAFPQILLIYIKQRQRCERLRRRQIRFKIKFMNVGFFIFFLLPPFHLFLFAFISLLTFLSWKPCKAIVSILIDRERYTDRCLNCLFQQLSCCERRTGWNASLCIWCCRRRNPESLKRYHPGENTFPVFVIFCIYLWCEW